MTLEGNSTTKQELFELAARSMCASFANKAVEEVNADIEKHGDDHMRLWRRLTKVVLTVVRDPTHDMAHKAMMDELLKEGEMP